MERSEGQPGIENIEIDRESVINEHLLESMEEIINGYFTKWDYKEALVLSETSNEKFGDISFYLSKGNIELDLEDFSQFLEQRFGKAILSKIERVGSYVNIFLDKNILVRDFLERQSLEADLRILKDKKVRVDYGNLNIDKPQNAGQLRNFFTGRGLSNSLKLAGANVQANVAVNDIGIKASRLFYTASKNPERIEEVMGLSEAEYYSALKQVMDTAKNDEEFEEGVKKINYGLHNELSDGRKTDLTGLAKKVTAKSVAEMKSLWSKLGLENLQIDLQSKYESETGIRKELLEAGKKENLFYEKEGILYANIDEINLGQHVLVKEDGTDTYVIKDIVALITHLANGLDREYICIGPSLFDHYDVVLYILNRLYPDIAAKIEVIRHQLSHVEDQLETNIYSLLASIDSKLDAKDEEGGMSRQEIIRTNLIFQNASNSLTSHVNIKLSKFTQTKGETGAYILYTVNRFRRLFKQSTSGDSRLDEESNFEEIEQFDISPAEGKLLIKFLFLKKKLEKTVKEGDPALIYREFMAVTKLLNNCYQNIPGLNPSAKKGADSSEQHSILIKKIFKEYEYLYSVLFA